MERELRNMYCFHYSCFPFLASLYSKFDDNLEGLKICLSLHSEHSISIRIVHSQRQSKCLVSLQV